MKKLKFIFLVFLFSIPEFALGEFTHEFMWHEQENKVDKVSAEIFNINLEKFAEKFTENSPDIKTLIWTAQELNKYGIHPYLIKVENQTENEFNLKISNWFFNQNLFRELKNNPFEPLVFPHPAISAILFLIALTATEVAVYQILSHETVSQIERIFTHGSTFLSLASYLGMLQYKINRNHKLHTTLKKLEKENVIQPNKSIFIPIFVAKNKKINFERNIKNQRLSFEDNTLTI